MQHGLMWNVQIKYDFDHYDLRIRNSHVIKMLGIYQPYVQLIAVANHYHLPWYNDYYQLRAPFWKHFTCKSFPLNFGFIMIAKRKGYNKSFRRLAWIPICLYSTMVKSETYFKSYNRLTSASRCTYLMNHKCGSFEKITMSPNFIRM